MSPLMFSGVVRDTYMSFLLTVKRGCISLDLLSLMELHILISSKLMRPDSGGGLSLVVGYSVHLL